jgi:hypothetical protein
VHVHRFKVEDYRLVVCREVSSIPEELLPGQRRILFYMGLLLGVEIKLSGVKDRGSSEGAQKKKKKKKKTVYRFYVAAINLSPIKPY